MDGLGLEYRSAGTWVKAKALEAGGSWQLPELAAGFAYGQKQTYDLRFTVANSPTTAQDLRLTSMTFLGSPIAYARTTLHVDPKSAATAPASTTAPAEPASSPGSPPSSRQRAPS